MTWLSSFFIHPAMAALGAGLIAVPIVIHLINRLQYRKVRFAAMEFLLQSQQRNSKRILIEQLLLLLLRILIVLLLVFIFARLIFDSAQLSLLERAETQHIVVLDDSGSMRDRWGESTAYGEGLNVIKTLATELAGQEGLQTMTLLSTSQPDRTASSFTQRRVDLSMISELEDKLELMQRECRYGQTDWSEVFSAIERMLQADQVQQRVVHIISDFRAGEWEESPTLADDLRSLSAGNTLINLIPAVPVRHENLAVTGLTGDVQTAAVRVPIRLTAEITNFGETVAENLAVKVLVDGEPIPQSITIPAIEPGDRVAESFEVVLTTPGEHAVSVQIPADALEADNIEYLTMNVPDRQRVLIVDGTPEFSEGLYIADALSADASITGVETLLVRPENLRDQKLNQFIAVYLLNISSLPPDALALLKEYVEQGGGVAWFLGNQVDAGFYHQLASATAAPDSGAEVQGENTGSAGGSLFPVKIGASPVEMLRAEETNPGADLQFDDLPMFSFLNAADGLLARYVQIFRYYPLANADETRLPEGVEVVARLRNQAPLFLESRLGEGRVFISLTSAGPMEAETTARWQNWPFDMNAPGFTVWHLELIKHLGARKGVRSKFLVNEPLKVLVNPAVYQTELRIEPPEASGLSTVILQATPVEREVPEGDETETAIPDTGLFAAEYAETYQPGIYRVTRENLAREAERELIAFNVPAAEGALELTTPAEMRTAVSGLDRVIVQEFGELRGIQRSDPGKELRTILLVMLVIIMIGEQFLAYRLGFHTREKSGQGKRTERPVSPGVRTGRNTSGVSVTGGPL